MKLNKCLIIMLAGLAMIGITSGQAIASGYGHGHGDNFCSQTARTVFHACRFDVFDDFNETKANCINIDDDGDRKECIDDAREAKREDWKGCRDQKEARFGVCDLIGEDRYADPLQDSLITFVDFEDDEGDPINPSTLNRFVNLTMGHTYVLRAGEDFEETVIVHVTDEVREVEREEGLDPVQCRVVIDAVMVREEAEEEGEEAEWVVDELTDDYFAQAAVGNPLDGDGNLVDSNVYYCGEISRNYEDGYLDNLDGSFFSGFEYAKAGVLTRQHPMVGQVDRQEYAIAEAEDLVEYVNLNANLVGVEVSEDFDYGCTGVDGDCLKTFDTSALDPESTEFKYYKAGVGFILAIGMDEGEVEDREELVCYGESLDILTADANPCGLEDAEGLLEKLCELSPNAFCVEEDEDE